ncbi:MAG TPA: hypothetical protein PLK37_11080 [Terricaulis sp.]|nr:hypothetical protein [Terricaulis sp.]
MSIDQLVIIDPRFNGPPGSGNGGYVCGLLAREIRGASEITLRAPPPLGKPLRLSQANGAVILADGEILLAEARPATLALEAPPAPSLAEAQAAAARYRGLVNHTYTTCFVCGPGRPAHDGLHLYTGAVEGRAMVACAWTPSADLADGDGRLGAEFIHAALDCPSYWALAHAGKPALLARMTASIDAAPPRIGAPLIVAAWALGSEGRKHRGASALYSADGALIARAEALWIEPRL